MFAQLHVALGVTITSFGNIKKKEEGFECEPLEHVARKMYPGKRSSVWDFFFLAAGKLLHNEKVGTEFRVVCDVPAT